MPFVQLESLLIRKKVYTMPCKYHPNALVEGRCECKKEFCSDCANLFIEGEKGKYYLCLDCAASIARKKITQSYIAAGIGFVSGIFLIREVGFFAPVLYAYVFWGTFFGWHYGGRIWSKLAKIDFDLSGIIVLALRIVVSIVVGTLGGGISQFLSYRKMLKKQVEFQNLSMAGVES